MQRSINSLVRSFTDSIIRVSISTRSIALLYVVCYVGFGGGNVLRLKRLLVTGTANTIPVKFFAISFRAVICIY
jgi:hypothetical protein